MRAHANCLENLPIYTVVVIALLVTETKSPWLDGLAIILLIARIAHNQRYIIAHNQRYILAPRRRSSSQVGANVVLAYAEMKNRSCVSLNAIFSAH
jgi:uncharacterized membrane protein YecN with MAPEG domain